MKKQMALITAALFWGSGAFAAEMKVGYVDMQKTIQSTEAGKKAKKELETEFNAKKKKLESREKELKDLKEDLDKKAMVMAEDVLAKKQKEFQEKMFEYQKQVAQSQQEISEKERDLTKPILEKIRKVIDKLANSDGYTVILEKNEQSVLWAKKEIDITDKVISTFEKEK